MSDYVSMTEAARRLGVTTRTIHNYISRGDLPAYRLGTKILRFRPEDLDALLKPVGGGES